MKLKIESIIDSCEKDGIYLAKTIIEFIGIIKKLEERKRIKNIKLLQQQIDDINNKTNKIIQELDNLKKPHQQFLKKKEEEATLNRQKDERKKEVERREIEKKISVKDEMKQIEEWTGMKIGNIIFDSNVDNWNVNTSVFDKKILNKSNLIFLIEDTDRNKFGGYIHSKIDKYDGFFGDPNAFVFSLKSNGRLNGMLKFDIKEPQYAFWLSRKTDNDLFRIGYDILFFKQNMKSCCFPSSFNYNEIQYALCGERNFTPKRITVIQLI